MSKEFPEFLAPPVVEVVLGVQFALLPNFTSGHSGWFWKKHLGDEWVSATDVPPLPDQFETFGASTRGGSPQLLLQLTAAPPRLQILNKAGDRLIQLQPTRFHYNWQKKDGAYPRFRKVHEEFNDYLNRFRSFVEEAGLGKLTPNQWEITYVDRIPRGELWEKPSDWHRVLSGLLAPEQLVEGICLESVGGEWHFEITPSHGRLHVAVMPGTDETGQLALLLQTTARGPIGKGFATDLEAGILLGHEAAVRQFLRITSSAAQKVWSGKA